jgi:hypothetical protein
MPGSTPAARNTASGSGHKATHHSRSGMALAAKKSLAVMVDDDAGRGACP